MGGGPASLIETAISVKRKTTTRKRRQRCMA